MEFNKILLNKLGAFLQKEGFHLSEQFENYLKFESDNSVVVICRDKRENSNLLYIGKTEGNQYLIDGSIIKRFCVSNLEKDFKIPERTIEDFADNLFLLFTGKGYELLKKDSKVLYDIAKFVETESEEYTSELLLKQALESASKAWETNDYVSFVDKIDKIGIAKIPQSYQLKYKIAKQKL